MAQQHEPDARADARESFDPRSLIEAVKTQAPDFPWLADALMACGAGLWESPAYVAYVAQAVPNQPEGAWQFEASILLQHEALGRVVIDVLKGNRVGGIEFLDIFAN